MALEVHPVSDRAGRIEDPCRSFPPSRVTIWKAVSCPQATVRAHCHRATEHEPELEQGLGSEVETEIEIAAEVEVEYGCWYGWYVVELGWELERDRNSAVKRGPVWCNVPENTGSWP